MQERDEGSGKKVVLRTQKRRGELGRVAKLLLHVFLRGLSRGRLGIHREKAFLYTFWVPQTFYFAEFCFVLFFL